MLRTLLAARRATGADIRVVPHEPAPAVLVSPTGVESDPRGTSGTAWRRDPVVHDAQRAPCQIGAVVRPGDPERLGQPRRARGQLTVAPRRVTPVAHDLDALDGRAAPQQYRARPARLTADDVGAPMHAVREVHVEVAGRAEHHAIARRLTPIPVAPRILVARVRLDLDEPDGDPTELRVVGDEELVEQVGRELTRVTCVERARERSTAPRRRHASSSQVRWAASRALAAASWSRTGWGPAPPGVVRRRTDSPGSSTARASVPSRGSVIKSSSRATPRSAASRTSDPTASCASRNGTPCWTSSSARSVRSEEHTSELQSRENLVCRLLLEKKKKKQR